MNKIKVHVLYLIQQTLCHFDKVIDLGSHFLGNHGEITHIHVTLWGLKNIIHSGIMCYDQAFKLMAV